MTIKANGVEAPYTSTPSNKISPTGKSNTSFQSGTHSSEIAEERPWAEIWTNMLRNYTKWKNNGGHRRLGRTVSIGEVLTSMYGEIAKPNEDKNAR